jgi:dTDP-4-dehydrorhamnose 3,5-epimerase-like enzyme
MVDQRSFARVDNLYALSLPLYNDARGTLVPLEFASEVPFPVVRLFWISQVPAGVTRGGHAHKVCRQFMICVAGRVHVEVSDCVSSRGFELRPGQALNVPPALFASETYLEAGSTLLVLCDRPFEVDDYLDGIGALEEYRTAAGAE